MRLRFRMSLFLSISFLLTLTAGSQPARVAEGKTIMIVAHPLAAQAGLEVFEAGGNVVDAAVATAYALGVVEPHGSGIGGEGMMLIYRAKERAFTIIDFKAISPAAASYQSLDFQNVRSWARSAKGASVPGAVAGLELARETFGRLDRSAVLKPAITYAMQGFTVDSILAANLASARKSLGADPASARIFYPNGNAPAAGSMLSNPEYGRSLKEIEQHGPSAFYEGRIADLIVKDAERCGAFISKEDLKAYRPLIREPLRGSYRGFEIVTTPPPCGGMLLLETLNILEYFDLAAANQRDHYDLHLLGEAFKMIYRDELAHNGDPEFQQLPVDRVSSKAYAFRRFQEINLAHSRNALEVPPGVVTDKNTTHLSVMDAEGNAVALTITLSSLFGTAHAVEGGGFLLNNELQNFNADSTHPNSLKPHKRVVTSLVPTVILKDGRPVYVTGAPGGDLIISSVAQVIVNLIDYKMSIGEAVAAPRIFSTFYQKEMEIENLFPESAIRQLASLGHEIKRYEGRRAYFAVAHSIQYDWERGVLIGAADPRRSGAAIGK